MTRLLEIALERLPAPGRSSIMFTDQGCVALFHVNGRYHAINDSCPHQGASLAGGKVDGGSIQCPAHGLRFNLDTGCMLQSPDVRLVVYPIHIEQGKVFVCLPAFEERP